MSPTEQSIVCNNTTNLLLHKNSRQNAKRVISLAKEKKWKECASELNDPEHQNETFRISKQMVKEHTHTHTTVLRLCGNCPGQPG